MRYAKSDDLPDIVAIYNSAVATRLSTADTQKVTIGAKADWFQKHTPDKRPIFVHEEDGEVVAWVSFESFYGRPAYDHTAEISIYVSPRCQGRGMGRLLLQNSIETAQRLDIKTLIGFIFSHNEPSLRLFKSFGFRQWGMLPDIAEMDGTEYSLSILGKRVKP
ncbi:MAG: GNAT family N-acetyltransferase [Desulfobacterales bacterium]|nr:GNAT family N-acetyltransferase [Desulfobacterales bacterium]